MSRPPPPPSYRADPSAPPASRFDVHRPGATHSSRALAAARGHAAAATLPPATGAPTELPESTTWPAGTVPFLPMGPAPVPVPHGRLQEAPWPDALHATRPAAAPWQEREARPGHFAPAAPPSAHHHPAGWADSPPAAVPWNVHGPWTHHHPHPAPAPTPWFQEARPAPPPLPPPPAHWPDPYDAHGSANVPVHPSPWAAARTARFGGGGGMAPQQPPAVAERRDGPTFHAPSPWPVEAPPPRPPPSGLDPRTRDVQWPLAGPPPGPARHRHFPVEPRDRDRPIIDAPQVAMPPPSANARRDPLPSMDANADADAPNVPALDDRPAGSAPGDDLVSRDSTPADAPGAAPGAAQPRPRPYFVLTRVMYDLMVECVELQAVQGRDAITAAGRINEITASVGTTMLERRRWKRLLGNLALVDGGPRGPGS
ncbi:hypothetical protein AMAG_03754 [Allomyces macrogynus ATCC 38327]|uniref:Uncharacterized protein n=1 Tax=Allomyces macrogynus (strain ATCC 38327) TaxID=578462 RepID=A0A0L0SAA0_ALLM3|nr:hypothetical protein AMAG_03754 [Allomyces macrogynus ATCC 38327]|eukprot:KNE59478.1 hypothetical protein AMAG_03754 [Allomyces macrogynus ATCC 38327]